MKIGESIFTGGIASCLAAGSRLDDLVAPVLGWNVLLEGQSFITILDTVMSSISGIGNVESAAVLMYAVTLQDIFSTTYVNANTDFEGEPFDARKLHPAAASILHALLSPVPPPTYRTMPDNITARFAGPQAGRQQATNSAPSPSHASPKPSAPAAVAGTPSTQPGAAAPADWCWQFQRPGGCQRPPGTCRKPHVMVPCPRFAAGNCNLAASA